MEIPDKLLKDLAYYLDRSVCWIDEKDGWRSCYNIVAEEGYGGNAKGERAMKAREKVMELIKGRGK